MNKFITLATIEKQKNIILIAHKNKKSDLIQWCIENKEILKNHILYAESTIARIITDYTGISVSGYNSGPLGDNRQIGAKIMKGEVDFIVFFSDILSLQPQDPSVNILLRIAQVYDIQFANNKESADNMIKNEKYEHQIINYTKYIKEFSY